MVPVGRRVDLPPDLPPDGSTARAPDVSTVDAEAFDWQQFDWQGSADAAPNAPPGFAEYWKQRTTRTEYCRLRPD